MASWLFGASKLKSDNITEAEPKPTESTTNPEPTTNTPTTSRLMYDLQPAKPKPEENVKVTSMLDNIPFVLSSQINMNTNSYTDSLEDTKKCLMSVKKLLDSDFYNYDFSNDRKLVRDHNNMFIS